MGVNDTWVSPAAGGVLDLATGGTVTEPVWDAVISDLLHLGGTAGYVPAAALAAEAWTDFTPTVTQYGLLSISLVYSRYVKLGRLAVVRFCVTLNAAGTGGYGVILGGIPAVIAPASVGSPNLILGSAMWMDLNTKYVAWMPHPTSASEISFTESGPSSPATGALAAGDVISGILVYETAS